MLVYPSFEWVIGWVIRLLTGGESSNGHFGWFLFAYLNARRLAIDGAQISSTPVVCRLQLFLFHTGCLPKPKFPGWLN